MAAKYNQPVKPIIEKIFQLPLRDIEAKLDAYAKLKRTLSSDEREEIEQMANQFIQLTQEFNSATSTENEDIYAFLRAIRSGNVINLTNYDGITLIERAKSILMEYRLKLNEQLNNRLKNLSYMERTAPDTTKRTIRNEKIQIEDIIKKVTNPEVNPSPKALSFFSQKQAA